MGLESFLVVAAIIFSIGLYGALTKRHAITVLMSIELMFNGVNISAVAMSRYIVPATLAQKSQVASDEVVQFLLTGQVFAVFIITVAAAEVAVALALIMTIYRTRQSVFVTDINQLRK